MLEQVRAIWGPVGNVALAISFPILIVISIIWTFAVFATAMLLAIVRAVIGDEASSRYEVAFGRALHVISVGAVGVFFYSRLEEGTRGWRDVNLPAWLLGYFVYVGIVWAVVIIYVAIWLAGSKLLTKFPILQYVLLGIIVISVIVGLTSPHVRDCNVNWTIRGPVCD